MRFSHCWRTGGVAGLLLLQSLSGCAGVTPRESVPCPTASASPAGPGRWLASRSATVLTSTGDFFVGLGNVGLQITGGTQFQGSASGHEFAVYLGITVVSAGSIGVGNLFIAGGERMNDIANTARGCH